MREVSLNFPTSIGGDGVSGYDEGRSGLPCEYSPGSVPDALPPLRLALLVDPDSLDLSETCAPALVRARLGVFCVQPCEEPTYTDALLGAAARADAVVFNRQRMAGESRRWAARYDALWRLCEARDTPIFYWDVDEAAVMGRDW